MILKTKSLIKEGSVSSTASLLIVADMFENGSIELAMEFLDCDGTSTLFETFNAARDGYNAFYREIDIGAWSFLNVTIEKCRGVRLVTDFYLNTQGAASA